MLGILIQTVLLTGVVYLASPSTVTARAVIVIFAIVCALSWYRQWYKERSASKNILPSIPKAVSITVAIIIGLAVIYLLLPNREQRYVDGIGNKLKPYGIQVLEWSRKPLFPVYR